jgi:AcrR family transcriptional regulator
MNNAPAASTASTRDRIVAAARCVFAERGYDGASIREITTRASANLGAVTYHFGSKQALYEAVLEDALRPLFERLTSSPSPSGESALDAVERSARAIFEHLRSNPDLQFLVLQQMATQDVMPAPAARVFGGIFGGLAARIAEGQRRGEVRSGDPLLMAVSVASQPAYFALVARFMLDRLSVEGGAPSWDEIAEHGVGFIRAGLTASREDG